MSGEFFSAADLARERAPERRWIVKGLIPDRTVTLLAGDGGTGKSLLALQLSIAVAEEGKWLGMSTASGRVVYLSAEDERHEVHRRLEDVCAAHGATLADLHDVRVWDLASSADAILARPDGRSGGVVPTDRWERLRSQLAEFRPKLLVVDTLADVFGGDEIIRSQARGFIGMFRGIAAEFDLAVLVLSHPSISGIKSGTGTSGSTAWSNSVRSRLYLERVDGVPEQRTLSVRKANYGPEGEQLRLRWHQGAFWPIGAEVTTAKAAADQNAAERKFLELLGLYQAQGRDVSAKPSRSYAPALFAEHPGAGGFKSNVLAEAMERLLAGGNIRMETFGPPSKQRSRLVTIKANGLDVGHADADEGMQAG